MSPAPSQPRPDDEEESLHYRAMARKLADMAMQMAEQVVQDAQAAHQPGADHTIRFERASRTVRRAILLARKLAEPLPTPRAPRPPAIPPLDRTEARKRIIRDVEDAIHRERRSNPHDVETLEAELLDRLDRPEFEHDLATRPIEQIIAGLAHDLGVTAPTDERFRIWKPRTQADIALLEARAAAPLPTGPGTPRRSPGPLPRNPYDIKLPDGPAQAVAAILALGKIRDG